MVLSVKSAVRHAVLLLACGAPCASLAQAARDKAFDADGHPYARYDRALAEAVELQGVDFDHHYTLAKIGCGASCILMAAVDHGGGGKVVWFPHVIANWPPSPTHEPVFNSVHSGLITVIGQLDEQGSIGPRRYTFDGRRFTPTR